LFITDDYTELCLDDQGRIRDTIGEQGKGLSVSIMCIVVPLFDMELHVHSRI